MEGLEMSRERVEKKIVSYMIGHRGSTDPHDLANELMQWTGNNVNSEKARDFLEGLKNRNVLDYNGPRGVPSDPLSQAYVLKRDFVKRL